MAAARNAPGSIVLFKGVDQARLSNVFNDAGEMVDDFGLLSSASSDFSRMANGLYFAVDRDVALYYARYARRRQSVRSVAIVQVTIKNSAIESLEDGELQQAYWPSSDWKSLVFTCRRFMVFPTFLRKFKLATIIIGTISKKPRNFYMGLGSAEDIT